MRTALRGGCEEIDASLALAECLQSGLQESAIAILKRAVEFERTGQNIPAGWGSSLEELIAVCLEHSLATQNNSTVATLEYAEALIGIDGIARDLRSGSGPVVDRLLAALTA